MLSMTPVPGSAIVIRLVIIRALVLGHIVMVVVLTVVLGLGTVANSSLLRQGLQRRKNTPRIPPLDVLLLSRRNLICAS